MSTATRVLFGFLLVSPIVLIWVWARWLRHAKLRPAKFVSRQEGTSMEEAEQNRATPKISETPTGGSVSRVPVSFKMTFLVADKSLPIPPEPKEWEDTRPDVTLELRRVPGVGGQPECAALCVKKTCQPSQEVHDSLAELASGKLPVGSNLEFVKNQVDANGQFKPGFAVPLAALPDFLQKFCHTIYDELYETGQSWAQLLRWRLGLTSGQPQALYFKNLEFCMDGQSWHPLAQFISLKIRFGIPESSSGITGEVLESAAELRQKNESEPISRVMFREAWNLQQGNLRSALMIGYAAVETGCKEFIGKLVPNAKWLAMEAPTPPLPSILKNYLPTLPVRLTVGGRVFIPDRLRKAVREAMEARNTLAHSGVLDLTADQLENILRCFNDLLWLLDLYGGQRWAWQHLSVQTATEVSAVASPTAGQSVA
jgi:hypothetical protein